MKKSTNVIDSIFPRTFINESGCRIWTGYLNKSGYGRVKFSGQTWLVHRLVFHHLRNPIPTGMFVCHQCDTPACCNPDHLWLGTSADNTMDAKNKSRLAFGERNANAKLCETAVTEIASRYSSGEKLRSLADSFGVDEQILSRVVHGKSWTHVNRIRPDIRSGAFKCGDMHHNKKLNSTAVLEIIRRRDTGETMQRIADSFGVSLTAVHQVCSGHTWSSVTKIGNLRT